MSNIYLWQHWDVNYYWCWGRLWAFGEGGCFRLIPLLHFESCQYGFCCIISSLIVYHINFGWSCNLLSATLISWHHPMLWKGIIESEDQNTFPMRRAVELCDLRKRIEKTFIFYLCHITSGKSLPSSCPLSNQDLYEPDCNLFGTQPVASSVLNTCKARSSLGFGPFQVQVLTGKQDEPKLAVKLE